jgi:hypothetical protein
MEQLDTEDWKAFRRELQEHKAKKRHNLTSLVYKFCVAASVNCETKTEYHFRLTREGYIPVDVFPTSGKVHVLNKQKAAGKGYKKTDVIQFLINHFK